MTVGQLRSVVARMSHLDAEAVVWVEAIDGSRDGSHSVGVRQVEIADDGVTVYVESGYEGQICVQDM